jgi:hypothetical protein
MSVLVEPFCRLVHRAGQVRHLLRGAILLLHEQDVPLAPGPLGGAVRAAANLICNLPSGLGGLLR